VNERNARVAEAVAAAGIEPAITILDADAKTVTAAAEQLGCEVVAIANSLVFDSRAVPGGVDGGGHRGFGDATELFAATGSHRRRRAAGALSQGFVSSAYLLRCAAVEPNSY